MAEYVTIENVDGLMGPDWALNDDKPRFIAMANAYLSAQRLQPLSPIPETVVMAGAKLAAAAAEGNLYPQQSSGAVTSERVKAGSVESEKKYAQAEKHEALAERVQFALALLAPYRTLPVGITVGYGNGCA
tara:strand:- start:237 stop:629 length:393 start_codon:yes stop_codon:yes gene_type:complete